MCTKAAGRAISFEATMPARPSQTADLWLGCNITQLSKKPRRFAFVCKDISDRKKLEMALKTYARKAVVYV